MRLTSVSRYPVKSFRGEDVEQALVEPWGLAGDRRWMVVDADGDAITARTHPQLVLGRPTLLEGGGIELTHPAVGTITVPPPDGTPVRVTVFDDPLDGVPAPEADGWVTELVGAPARLVHLLDPTQRPVDPRFARQDDRVSFADGYPLLLATEASLAALNEAVVGRGGAPLPMTRFRPNLVVDGAAPWDEDGWRVVRVGDAVFRSVKGCARCVLTTVDPETAAKGKEPIATLARIRRFGSATWFATNLVPETPGAVVRPGDEVEVLEAVQAPDGPPR